MLTTPKERENPMQDWFAGLTDTVTGKHLYSTEGEARTSWGANRAIRKAHRKMTRRALADGIRHIDTRPFELTDAAYERRLEDQE